MSTVQGNARDALAVAQDRIREAAEDGDLDQRRAPLLEALDAHPGVNAMLAVSPTVAGVAADVAGLADVCHAHGIPLIMDDAWGADFSFHPELPPPSMQSG